MGKEARPDVGAPRANVMVLERPDGDTHEGREQNEHGSLELGDVDVKGRFVRFVFTSFCGVPAARCRWT